MMFNCIDQISTGATCGTKQPKIPVAVSSGIALMSGCLQLALPIKSNQYLLSLTFGQQKIEKKNEEAVSPPSTYLAQWCLIVLIKSVLVLPAALIIPMRSCQTINFFSFNYDKPPFCCGFEPSSHAYLIKIASPLGIPFFTVRNKNMLFFLLAWPLSPSPPHLVSGP